MHGPPATSFDLAAALVAFQVRALMPFAMKLWLTGPDPCWPRCAPCLHPAERHFPTTISRGASLRSRGAIVMQDRSQKNAYRTLRTSIFRSPVGRFSVHAVKKILKRRWETFHRDDLLGRPGFSYARPSPYDHVAGPVWVPGPLLPQQQQGPLTT